jgi:type VI secretion system ImpC/EvpB family protein
MKPEAASDPDAIATASGVDVEDRPARSLFDAIVEATAEARGEAMGALGRFLREPSPWEALALWLGRGARLRERPTRERVARLLSRDLARLDALIRRQVHAILHHPAFQKLEASWRGLRYLVEQVDEGENVKIRMLHVTWKELARDMERALEFDQSQLFRKVYEEEFGHPGGEPFGILLGDYEIRHLPGPDHPIDDLSALAAIASVSAAAFAPFIAGVHPSLLDLGSFADLERPLDVSRTFQQQEYLKWRAFRQSEDARFVGLTLPRVLRRLPYRDDGSRADPFRFREEVAAPDRGEYLWGNAVYAFGAVLIRAFAASGWFAAIRGVGPDATGGGVVTGLPVPWFDTERPGLASKCSTDVIITDAQEKELGELGFIPLCHRQDSDRAAFYGNQSVQKPQEFQELPATINARLSAMLQYTLCVSRFAHYLKVISRDKLGSFLGPSDCEDHLRRWLLNYTVANEDAAPELKARHPLREARVRVRERPERPGHYLCVAHLQPHFQLDQMAMAVRLVTELAPGRPE